MWNDVREPQVEGVQGVETGDRGWGGERASSLI